jgi:serralysin
MCMLCASLNPTDLNASQSNHLPGGASLGNWLSVFGGGGGTTPPAPTGGSLDPLAAQLTTGYWAAQGGGKRSFALDATREVTVDLSGLESAPELAIARAALDAWTEVSGIVFVNAAGGAPAQITFDNADPDGAYAFSTTSGSRIVESHVNIPNDWDTDPISLNSYWFQTYIHEIGHAIGLGHAGNYNGSAVWGRNNKFANDSWQATVMSYFPQTVNPNTGGASYAFTATLMAADIIAIQSLYGTDVQTRSGDTVYGSNSNVDGYLGDIFDQWIGGAPADQAVFIGNPITVTIFDTGGTDTLDVSRAAGAQRVDLNSLAKSDVGGLKGNIIIARGTVIENAIGGSGNDTLSGNAVANTLTGGDGADVLDGRAGNDSLFGGNGNDTLIGGAGSDYMLGGTGADRFDGGTEYDIVSYLDSTTTLTVDLMSPGLNIGDAFGDTYASIEIVIGGSAGDVILGAAASEWLSGVGGDDFLVGRAGKDTLDGGAGNDRLAGGAGGDALIGGDGRDVADYSGAGRGVVVNLETTVAGRVPRRGATDASGDTYSSVEDLWGSGFNDRLTGNADANLIWGNGGADIISGGLGNDTLIGGVGSDTFVFNSGADTVQDFVDNIDTISIARSLFGSATISVAQALAFAVVEGSDIVFRFNATDSFTLTGLTDITALQDDLIFV